MTYLRHVWEQIQDLCSSEARAGRSSPEKKWAVKIANKRKRQWYRGSLKNHWTHSEPVLFIALSLYFSTHTHSLEGFHCVCALTHWHHVFRIIAMLINEAVANQTPFCFVVDQNLTVLLSVLKGHQQRGPKPRQSLHRASQRAADP